MIALELLQSNTDALDGVIFFASVGFKGYVSMPLECFSSLANYTLTQDLQKGKFKKLPENASLSDKLTALYHNPIPIFAGGTVIFASLMTGGIALPFASMLLSKITDSRADSVEREADRVANSNLNRALNQVGRVRIPQRIKGELATTMLAVTASGDHRAVMPKLLAAFTVLGEFSELDNNPNLVIDIATTVARSSGGALPANVNNAALTALAQAATQNRGDAEAAVTEFARRLRANGVNFSAQTERDTRDFVKLVTNRVGRSR
jgi:hypothetical protein